MKVKEFVTEVATKASDNKGGILTGVTIFGAVVTTALTAVATWKIKEIIDKNDGVIDKNVVKDCVKVTVLPAGALLITVFSAAGAHKAEVAKYGALAALYASDSKKIEDLTKKLGKKENGVTVDKDGKLVKENSVAEVTNKSSAYDGDTNELNVDQKVLNKKIKILDKYTGQEIDCSINDILRAVKATNDILFDKDPYNDEIHKVYAWDSFYEELGVELRGSVNKSAGWTTDDGLINVTFDGAIDDNMQLYYTFKFNTDPHDIDAENGNKWRRY